MKRPFRLLIIGVAIGSVSCSGGDAENEPIVRPVRYVEVFQSGGVRVRRFSGVAQAAVEAPLSFRVGGTVQQLSVSVGDRVGTGQVIAALDPEDYRLQRQDAQAALRRAEAEARNAQASYDRVRGMYENDNASLTDLEAARTASESAAEQVQSATNRLGLAQRQLAFTRLTAPQAGAIAAVNVEVNQNVRAGQTVVLLTSRSDLEVAVAVPEMLIAEVREGSEVTVTFDALPDETFSGIVTEVGVAATETGAAFPVTVHLGESQEGVRSGMAAEVAFRFTAPGGSDVIVVPPVAVGEDQNGRFVFVVEPAEEGYGVARRRSVAVGELTTDGIEILEGLQDGDRVVTAGIGQIADGLRVRL
ncbi:MAG: efflux RND transporter periplasmic adaptor subunit [Gemmatimonadota bacterium]|nr:efflux RND transporter periplasmic adaptor subunit [Gemmatimonadota bacterium]MDH3366728.1 efflux RND transporter periplasmic adaptor subunit [Gemmatimonadota bacterium]MDH3478841.1 efflux RND transporter periplasmic adaptor subunit [Gemmatimonadota bacterium]MDH5549706.1 efflux RND transporter periplasmic adaptor subunit [Gemmatimonadota bacterium]